MYDEERRKLDKELDRLDKEFNQWAEEAQPPDGTQETADREIGKLMDRLLGPRTGVQLTSDMVKEALRKSTVEEDLASQGIRQALFSASAKDKPSIADRMTKEQAEEALRQLDAAPGDDPEARKAIYAKYPALNPATFRVRRRSSD